MWRFSTLYVVILYIWSNLTLLFYKGLLSHELIIP